MSSLSGGTDVKDYYEQYGGAVLSTTFDKYCYLVMRFCPPFFEYSGKLIYRKIEAFNELESIEHPIVREVLKKYAINDIQIIYDADLPARSGIGTSSAFTVGLLNGIHSLRGEFVDKMTLAKEAIHVERVLCNEAGGWQDQITAAFGGFNRIDFYENSYKVTPIVINQERKDMLDNNLMLFFTGFTRFSADIQEAAKASFEEKKSQLDQMLALVDEAQDILENKERDLDDFGRLLDKTWRLKRGLAKEVSTGTIDELYAKGIAAGALGGKLLGAGGGGFLLFYVPTKKQRAVKKALGLMEVPFHFERNGTRVVYFAPETYDLEDRLEDLVEEDSAK